LDGFQAGFAMAEILMFGNDVFRGKNLGGFVIYGFAAAAQMHTIEDVPCYLTMKIAPAFISASNSFVRSTRDPLDLTSLIFVELPPPKISIRLLANVFSMSTVFCLTPLPPCCELSEGLPAGVTSKGHSHYKNTVLGLMLISHQ
jgi:hypothetical protein